MQRSGSGKFEFAQLARKLAKTPVASFTFSLNSLLFTAILRLKSGKLVAASSCEANEIFCGLTTQTSRGWRQGKEQEKIRRI